MEPFSSIRMLRDINFPIPRDLNEVPDHETYPHFSCLCGIMIATPYSWDPIRMKILAMFLLTFSSEEIKAVTYREVLRKLLKFISE